MPDTLPFAEALATVLTHARTLPLPATETLPLNQSLHRVLATPVIAPRDQPPFPRSTRDGYAIQSADSGTRQIIGSIRAGQSWQGEPLQPGQAIEIMTGAPVPPGADAVVMVEHTTTDANTLSLEHGRTLKPGENIVPTGAEALTGTTLLPPGRLLTAAEIGLAASCGLAHLTVYQQPKVAILATGDELVELGGLGDPAHLEPAQIYNSNTHTLAALIRSEGGQPIALPIARDTLTDLRTRIAEALTTADLLLLSGGVSMGKYDLVEQVLAEFHATFHFTGALIQPGKPIVFGHLPSTPSTNSGAPCPSPLGTWVSTASKGSPTIPLFGLPGNPISTQVCFHLFVAPLLRALAGRTDIEPRFAEARLAADVPAPTRVTRFLPAELTSDWQSATVRVLPWQGSGDLATNARANGYCVLPADTAPFQAGDTVRVLLR